MLSKRYTPLVSSLLMSIIMVFIMTAIITAVNTGLDSGFLQRWGRAYLIAWPIAFVVILLIGRRMAVLAGRICSRP